MMLGGVIAGYCVSGRFSAATAPARVMTIDSTAAKIGRSMKKCENITALTTPDLLPWSRAGGPPAATASVALPVVPGGPPVPLHQASIILYRCSPAERPAGRRGSAGRHGPPWPRREF